MLAYNQQIEDNIFVHPVSAHWDYKYSEYENDHDCPGSRVSESCIICYVDQPSGSGSSCYGEARYKPTHGEEWQNLARLYLNNNIRVTNDILATKFTELANVWEVEIMFMSSVHDMAMTNSYQSIIGMGEDVVPLILKELERKPNHWFWALRALKNENPVPPEDAGNIKKMAEAWLRLGRQKGWI